MIPRTNCQTRNDSNFVNLSDGYWNVPDAAKRYSKQYRIWKTKAKYFRCVHNLWFLCKWAMYMCRKVDRNSCTCCCVCVCMCVFIYNWHSGGWKLWILAFSNNYILGESHKCGYFEEFEHIDPNPLYSSKLCWVQLFRNFMESKPPLYQDFSFFPPPVSRIWDGIKVFTWPTSNIHFDLMIIMISAKNILFIRLNR